MLDKIFNTAADTTTLSVGSAMLTIIAALALGLLISFTYIKTHKRGQYSQNFILTMVIIPSIIAIIILMVGSNVARAFSLAGAFSIARFRSASADPKDIAFVFFAMAAGLACGVGLIPYAILFTMILCIFLAFLCKVNFGARKISNRLLKITIPEDLDYQGAFDEILDKFTVRYELTRVKTTDLGTLFELVYVVVMKNNINEKEFIDEIRCRNGNLNINLVMNADTSDY